MPVVTIRDETTSGSRSDSFELTFPTESITVRELIRERIYQEVQDYNRRADAGPINFQGLVQPCASEVVLDRYKAACVASRQSESSLPRLNSREKC